MLARFGILLSIVSLMSVSTLAHARPYAAFTVHAGKARDAMSDGTVPQAVITLITSDTPSVCEDWLALEFKPNQHYTLMRLAAFPSGDGLTGCYEVLGRPSGEEGCWAKRGVFDGIQFVGAAPQENAGSIKSSRFMTGGHVKVHNLSFDEKGTGYLTGRASVQLGDSNDDLSVQAEWCGPTR